MKKSIMLLYLSAVFLVSCDDGHVDDPVYHSLTSGYTAKISGTFRNVDSWKGSYSVVVAGFAEDNQFATIQTVLPSDNNAADVILTNIPSNTKTIEIAVVNSLRKRIATLYSYTIPDNQQEKDSISINFGEANVGMFGAINKSVFQNGTTSCAKCHSSENGRTPAGQLDLSAENAYKSLVGIASAKSPSEVRVVPGDSEKSYLYKVITDGDDNVRYSHTGFFAGEEMAPILNMIKEWIDNGAKE